MYGSMGSLSAGKILCRQQGISHQSSLCGIVYNAILSPYSDRIRREVIATCYTSLTFVTILFRNITYNIYFKNNI